VCGDSLSLPTLPCPTSRVPLLLSDFSRRAVKDVNGVAERYLNVLPPWKHKTWLGGKQVYEDSPSEGVINAVYSGGLLLRAELACLFLLTASSVTFLPSVAAILLAHRANVAHPNTAKLDTKDLELVAKKCIEKSETDANYFSRLSPEEKQRTFKAWDTIDKQAMAWDLAQVVFQLPLSSPMLKCEGEAKHRLMRGVLMCLYEPLCNLQVAAAMCVVPQGDGQGSQPARFQTFFEPLASLASPTSRNVRTCCPTSRNVLAPVLAPYNLSDFSLLQREFCKDERVTILRNAVAMSSPDSESDFLCVLVEPVRGVSTCLMSSYELTASPELSTPSQSRRIHTYIHTLLCRDYSVCISMPVHTNHITCVQYIKT
jgi:hypothetical protein